MSNIRQILVIRKDLNMRKGKMIAQGAHASMMFLTKRLRASSVVTLLPEEEEWINGSFTKVCVSVNSESELRELISKAQFSNVLVNEVIDSGKTEFNGVPTLTCAAFGPDKKEKLDPITGHLPLL